MTSAPNRARRWLERLNGSKHMLWLLALFSFLETLIVPVPIELVLIPLMALNRQRIWRIATVTTVGCLAASLLGYGVGMVLYQSVGTWFIDTMGMQNAYQAYQGFFDRYGFIAILTLGILPIPFQVAMITAGLSGYPLALFMLAALIARGIRYYGLAWLVLRFGPRVERMWRRQALVTSLVAGLIVMGVALGMQWLARAVL